MDVPVSLSVNRNSYFTYGDRVAWNTPSHQSLLTDPMLLRKLLMDKSDWWQFRSSLKTHTHRLTFKNLISIYTNEFAQYFLTIWHLIEVKATVKC